MNFSAEKEDGTRIYVEFVQKETKINTEFITKLAQRMKKTECKHCIYIAEVLKKDKKLNTLIDQQKAAHGFFIEKFLEKELYVNITRHDLVPEHRPMKKEDIKVLLDKYKLNQSQLPRIKLEDPVTRYFGLREGDVFKIIRPSETAGQYVTYRIVV